MRLCDDWVLAVLGGGMCEGYYEICYEYFIVVSDVIV